MKEIQFDLTYTKNEECVYKKIPFDVPENIEKLEISYEYLRFDENIFPEGIEKREKNIVDIGLYDEKSDLRGWSGSQRREFFISASESTPGYQSGSIKSGVWAVALGLYVIENTVNVRLIIKLFPQKCRILKGDLHIHSVNSDGMCTVSQITEMAKRENLDFIALTDHNTLIQNSEIGNSNGISVIAGMEYTNYRGHANFYFKNPGIQIKSDPLSNSFNEMQAVFAKTKDSGALISLNHIMCDNCPWEFGFEGFDFDMIEVWNSLMKESDMRAIAFWHKKLLEGKKLAIVSGSDFHRHTLGAMIGSPCIFVYANSASSEDILRAISKGNSFIAMTSEGPIIDFTINDTIFGETIQFSNSLEGRLKILSVRKGDIVKIISDKEESIANVLHNGIYEKVFSIKQTSFYRIEVYRNLLGRVVIVALSNPIYISA